MKKMLALILSFAMIATPIVVLADETNSNDSTIGTASAAEMAEYVARKNALIEEYYQQKVAGDPEAANTLNELNAYSTQFAAEHGDTTAQKNLTASVTNASSVSRATSNSLNVTWIRQLNDHYCGPATAEMIIEYKKGNVTSQSTLAGINYLKTDQLGQTGWYMVDGMDVDDYIMAKVLNSFNLGLTYIPRPYKATGTTLTANNLKSSTVASIDGGNAMALNCQTKSGNTAMYTGYPIASGHWSAIIGYNNSGSSIRVADPYSGFESNSIPQKYYINASTIVTLANAGSVPKGIIY